ncbi:MAG: shikimate kinase [Oscillospiraceae bacterium]|nr:shikimate kinase [Oscillospiraceae bacterium]
MATKKVQKSSKAQKAQSFQDLAKPKAKLFFLSGFMGSGKTTAGEMAAKKIGVSFVDLDSETEKTLGKPIAEVFEKHGEAYFRRAEAATLGLVISAASLITTKALIVALGGGTIIDPKNAALINEFGASIFIDCDFELCYNRILKDSQDESKGARPLAKSREELETLFKARQGIYFESSQDVIDGNDCSLNVLSDRIANFVVEVVSISEIGKKR